jgi:uncharacterized membrane protein YoaT (DUF817 family)
MNDTIIKRAEDLLHNVDIANSEYITFWINYIVLSWRWWLCTIIVLCSWILWFIFRNKDCTGRLLLAGFLTMAISELLDAMGEQLGIWSYNVDVEPFSPAFITFDLTLLPIATMAFIQYKPNINPFFKAVIFSGIGSFIAQPVFAFLGIYNRQSWKDYYSFPIFIVLYLVAHYFSRLNSFDKL